MGDKIAAVEKTEKIIYMSIAKPKKIVHSKRHHYSVEDCPWLIYLKKVMFAG